MNINKSIQRISWRFSNSKPFTPNNNDMEALNNIINWVNSQRKETLNNNHLFAKLYIYVYGSFLNYYKSTPLEKIPRVELSRLLDTPMNLHYTELFDIINLRSCIAWMDSKGLYSSHFEDTTDQEKEILKKLSLEDMKIFVGESWEYDDVVSSVNLMITESLNKFS